MFSVQLVLILSLFVLSPAPRAEVVRNARTEHLVYDDEVGCYDVCAYLYDCVVLTTN